MGISGTVGKVEAASLLAMLDNGGGTSRVRAQETGRLHTENGHRDCGSMVDETHKIYPFRCVQLGGAVISSEIKPNSKGFLPSRSFQGELFRYVSMFLIVAWEVSQSHA